MTEYNGHRSWNSWNVNLWITNDEPTYRLAMECIKDGKTPRKASRLFSLRSGLLGTRTPDGATYNQLCIDDCIKSLMEDYEP